MFRVLLITILFQFSAVAEETRILFVGNSYTGQVRKTVSSFIKASPEGGSTHLEFISPGGKNLEFHLKNKATTDKIREGNWDYVFLQDQSQTPAVFPKRFESGATGLDKLIDAAGAKTVFYQTWGRRDGYKMNAKLFPTYESMQKALSKNYISVAKQCDAVVAPVGDTWALVRKANPALGKALYKGDGSHPSAKGAYLAACVFYATVFKKSPETVRYKGGLSDEEAAVIVEAVRKTSDSNRWKGSNAYPVERTLTNQDGRKIKAQITGRSKSKVYFKSGGKDFSFDLEQLSAADQTYLKTLPANR